MRPTLPVRYRYGPRNPIPFRPPDRTRKTVPVLRSRQRRGRDREVRGVRLLFRPDYRSPSAWRGAGAAVAAEPANTPFHSHRSNGGGGAGAGTVGFLGCAGTGAGPSSPFNVFVSDGDGGIVAAGTPGCGQLGVLSGRRVGGTVAEMDFPNEQGAGFVPGGAPGQGVPGHGGRAGGGAGRSFGGAGLGVFHGRAIQHDAGHRRRPDVLHPEAGSVDRVGTRDGKTPLGKGL